MNFKLKLGLVSLSYLGQFNSKSNIQDEFWNLEIKSFYLAPRFLGLNELLMEKSPPKDSTEVLSPPLYKSPEGIIPVTRETLLYCTSVIP